MDGAGFCVSAMARGGERAARIPEEREYRQGQPRAKISSDVTRSDVKVSGVSGGQISRRNSFPLDANRPGPTFGCNFRDSLKPERNRRSAAVKLILPARN
ncbi:hypothetical protein KM043_012228 [Ampulex compressa]|nr:hypothetical protein KM043_012228 [Ampulex compressa]